MNQPIGRLSRLIAGMLGTFILTVGLVFASTMLQREWYFFVALGLLLAFGGSAAFLQAAWKGESPPWPDEARSTPSSKDGAV